MHLSHEATIFISVHADIQRCIIVHADIQRYIIVYGDIQRNSLYEDNFANLWPRQFQKDLRESCTVRKSVILQYKYFSLLAVLVIKLWPVILFKKCKPFLLTVTVAIVCKLNKPI